MSRRVARASLTLHAQECCSCKIRSLAIQTTDMAEPDPSSLHLHADLKTSRFVYFEPDPKSEVRSRRPRVLQVLTALPWKCLSHPPSDESDCILSLFFDAIAVLINLFRSSFLPTSATTWQGHLTSHHTSIHTPGDSLATNSDYTRPQEFGSWTLEYTSTRKTERRPRSTPQNLTICDCHSMLDTCMNFFRKRKDRKLSQGDFDASETLAKRPLAEDKRQTDPPASRKASQVSGGDRMPAKMIQKPDGNWEVHSDSWQPPQKKEEKEFKGICDCEDCMTVYNGLKIGRKGFF